MKRVQNETKRAQQGNTNITHVQNNMRLILISLYNRFVRRVWYITLWCSVYAVKRRKLKLASSCESQNRTVNISRQQFVTIAFLSFCLLKWCYIFLPILNFLQEILWDNVAGITPILLFCNFFTCELFSRKTVQGTEAVVRRCSVKKVFLEIEGLRSVAWLKKSLWHGCFPLNFAKFLKTPYFTKHLWWLLLKVVIIKSQKEI